MHTRLTQALGLLVAFAAALSAPADAQGPAARPAAGRDTARKRDLPLAAARTASFTTSKGSWISLDVSPDGRTIVFDLLGDLYTMPIAGGRATRLTSGMAYDVQPRFSPDGKRVVFVSDRSGGDNLWIMSLDGKDTTQVTKGNNNLYVSPEWTPDGKYIVASRSGGLGGAAKLWIFHTEGGTGQTLVPVTGPTPPPPQLAQLKMVGAAFGKDARYIWYASRQGDWTYNAILPQYQLGVYDRETGTQTSMSARLGSGFRPAVSLDGKWLAYGSRHKAETGLRLRDIESGEERWLLYPIQRDDQESRASIDVLPGYSFTPDSRAVVISHGGEIWRAPVDGSAPSRIPFTADVNVEIGPEVRFSHKIDDARTLTAKQIRDVAPSPDGTKLAFTALNRVYVVDLPAAGPQPATTGAPATAATTATITGARRVSNLDVNEHFPIWSPDGRSLAFVSWSDRDGGHIYRVPVDARGARPQQLTRVAAYYTRPAWSPDGRRIVAVRAAARDRQEAFGGFTPMLGAQFVYVPATGGDVTAIGPTAGRSWPHFVASDTNRIYAYSFSEGLVSMRWDGTDVKAIVKVTGPMPPTEPGPQPPQPPPASMVKMSPKGERALAQVGNDIYVVTVPFVGGQTPSVSVASPENAAFPIRKLTDVAGQFPVWGTDGNTVHWGIGNAYAVYDLERARQVEDSMRQAQRSAPRDTASPRPEPQRDTTQRTDSIRTPVPKPDSLIPLAKPAAPDTTKRGYRPLERRVVVTVTRDVPRATAVLRGARVVTMRGREVIENADVVVRDNRIVAVGARGSVQVPGDAQVIDVAGKTILPGFVDTHYHPQWLAPEIHSSQVWQYLATLAYGTTTTRDPQTSSTDVLTYGDRVETGDMIGPRVYSTGPGVFLMELIRDAEHAKTVLRRYAQYYDTKTLKMYMTGNRQQRQWVIMAAKELGLMPTTEGGLDYKLNMTHAIDGYSGLEHSLPIAPLYDDVVQLFVKSGITYTPTLLVSYGGPWAENYYYTTENFYNDPKLQRFMPEVEIDARFRRRGAGAGGSPGPGGWFLKEEYVFPKHAEFVKRLVDAGGRAGIGSHGQLQGLGYHWEMWSMASGGMSNHDVLRVATILGAEAIGFGGDVGSVEPGKLADLVVLDANPLENIRNTNTIRYVMKNGRLYDGRTLDEVYPTRRALPAFAWQRMGPTVSGNNGR
ncbi:MAG: amidohydrolase family protein [Gemmatimonadaceae bacterium]